MIRAGESSPAAAMMRGLPVFGMFEDNELETLASVFRSEYFMRGAVLLKEGKAPRSFYVLVEGQITLSKKLGRVVHTVASLEKNTILGHPGLIDRGTSEVTAIAATDILALVCDRDMFGRLASSSSPMALKLMVPLVTACCRAARACDALAHGLYADPQATLLKLHTI